MKSTTLECIKIKVTVKKKLIGISFPFLLMQTIRFNSNTRYIGEEWKITPTSDNENITCILVMLSLVHEASHMPR